MISINSNHFFPCIFKVFHRHNLTKRWSNFLLTFFPRKARNNCKHKMYGGSTLRSAARGVSRSMYTDRPVNLSRVGTKTGGPFSLSLSLFHGGKKVKISPFLQQSVMSVVCCSLGTNWARQTREMVFATAMLLAIHKMNAYFTTTNSGAFLYQSLSFSAWMSLMEHFQTVFHDLLLHLLCWRSFLFLITLTAAATWLNPCNCRHWYSYPPAMSTCN